MSGQGPTPPVWPAVLKFAARAELGFVRSADEWALDADLYAHRYSPEDRLIDSTGREFRLVARPPKGRAEAEPLGTRVTPDELRKTVERHLHAVQRPPEFLAGFLSDVPPARVIAAAILYVGQVGREAGEEE